MLIRRRIPTTAVGCMMLLFMLGGVLPVRGQTALDSPPALLVKIRDIDRILKDLESLIPAQPGAGSSAQTAIIKGLLQGTDWIDPSRSVVAGMSHDGQAAAWVVLLPFQRPNENFRTAYGAVAGDDYYILRFPPGPEPQFSDRQRDELLLASKGPAAAGIVAELAAHDALDRFGPRIESAIQNMVSQAAVTDGRSSFTPEDLQRMARDMIASFEQVKTLRFGLNTDSDVLMLLMDIEAVPDSFLAGLLIDRGTQARLGAYQPDYPLRFRSRAYNVAGAMQMLGASFGAFYRQMGFDFDAMAEIAKGLTGEMVGGMALDHRGMTFEMIYALHDSVNSEDYLTSVYLPWFEQYNRRMAAMMEAQTGQPVTAHYERMPDTAVAGRRVIGVRTRFPALTASGRQTAAQPFLQEYQTRLTAVDDLILMASSDAAIERMIAGVQQLRDTPAEGPWAGFSMDMGAYLRGLKGMMAAADGGQEIEIPADIGDLTMEAEVDTGRLAIRTRMKTRDVQRTVALFAALSERMAGRAAISGGISAAAADDKSAPGEHREAPLPEGRQTPMFWMDRGGLLSAYGNYQGAVRCYQKALERAPEMAEAHFQMGVALGELERFAAAVAAISRAIGLRPANGAYYYGRGRVYLRAGDADLAMKDFMEAGFLGNEEARDYLRPAGVDWN